jgi:hypothetical protein
LEKLSEYLDLDVLELRACDQMLQKVPARLRPVYLFATKLFNGWKDSFHGNDQGSNQPTNQPTGMRALGS